MATGLRQFYINGESYHPFRDFGLLRHKCHCLVQVPMDLMVPNAVAFVDVDGQSLEGAALRSVLDKMLRAFADHNFPDPNSNLHVFVETPPRRSNAREDAAWRLWFFFPPTLDWWPGDAIEDMFAAGAAVGQKRKRQEGAGGKKANEPKTHGSWNEFASIDDWLRLINAVGAGVLVTDVPGDPCRTLSLRHTTNPANPMHIFHAAVQFTSVPDIDPRFVDLNNYLYVDINTQKPCWKFPEPELVWRLTPHQAQPTQFFRSFFPKIRQPESAVGRDADFFQRRQAARLENDPCLRALEENQGDSMLDTDGDVKMDANHLFEYVPSFARASASAFQYGLQQTAAVETFVTPITLRARHVAAWDALRQKREDLMKQRGLSLNQANELLREERNTLWERHLSAFRMYWTSHSNVMSECLLQVVIWGQERLSRSPTFASKRPTLTQNLLVTADWMLARMMDAEHIDMIYTAHEAYGIIPLAQNDMYGTERDDHIHVGMFGGTGKSKSFVLKACEKCFIPGSIIRFSHQSRHFMTAAKNGTLDNSCFHCHEMNSKRLGTVDDGPGSGGNARSRGTGTNDDDENFFKNVTDTGEFRAQSMRWNSEDGKRECEDIYIPMSTTWIFSTNVPEYNVAPAVLDRLLRLRFRDFDRSDRDQTEMAMHQPSAEARALRERRYDNMRCDQYLNALTSGMLSAGNFPFTDVNVGLARVKLCMILLRAMELGMPKLTSFRAIRITVRLMINLAMFNCQQKTWHAEASPLRNRPWTMDMMKYVAPNLRVTDQDLILALGIMKNAEFENPLMDQVLRAMEKAYFPTTTDDSKRAPSSSSSSSSSNDDVQVTPIPPASAPALDHVITTRLASAHDTPQKRAKLIRLSPYLERQTMFVSQSSGTRTTIVEDRLEMENVFSSRKDVDAKSRKIMQPSEVFRRIAFDCIQHLEGEKPTMKELTMLLHLMTDRVVSTLDGKSNQRMLEITDRGFKLATSAVLDVEANRQSYIERAIHDVLEFKDTPQQAYLFEFIKSRDDLPHLPRLIELRPNPNKATFKMREPAFATDTEFDLLAELSLPATESPRVIDLEKIFKRSPESEITGSLDEWEWQDHLLRHCFWTLDEAKALNFGSEATIKELALKERTLRLGKASAPLYPDAFRRQLMARSKAAKRGDEMS
jgi:hypothetical protein